MSNLLNSSTPYIFDKLEDITMKQEAALAQRNVHASIFQISKHLNQSTNCKVPMKNFPICDTSELSAKKRRLIFHNDQIF